tara:strand:- start:917 stop:1108 length:192 start_codon:yes stop_codon:yes gene_type:complete
MVNEILTVDETASAYFANSKAISPGCVQGESFDPGYFHELFNGVNFALLNLATVFHAADSFQR